MSYGGTYHYGNKPYEEDEGGFGKSSGGSKSGYGASRDYGGSRSGYEGSSRSGERDYGGSRSGYEGSKSGYGGSRYGYEGSKSGYGGSRSEERDYGGSRSGYEGSKSGYGGSRSEERDYGGSRSGYGSREGDYGSRKSGERDSRSGYGGGERDHGGSKSGYGSREGDYGGSRDYHASRASAGRGKGAYQGGHDDGGSGYGRREEPEEEDVEQKIQAAYRRMEQSSGSALRTVHETLNMGIDTTEELERQAETMDRTETRLDEMEQDLDVSKRHMRNIKSVFGGIGNYFARKKDTSAITDPKISGAAKKKPAPSSSSKSSAFPDRGPGGRGEQAQYQTTGSQVVDRNMDEMEKALYQLKGVGELISDQLDDSDAQLDRVKWKMERGDVKIKGLNKDIKRQL